LVKPEDTDGVFYSLITNPEMLKYAVPFYPLMPSNAGKVLSQLTLVEPASKPIAAIIRPCELRAFTELQKRSQGDSGNFLFISSTCGGVYPLKTAVTRNIEGGLDDYWSAVMSGELISDLRANCQACTQFLPYNADLTVDITGNGNINKQCDIYLNTLKAIELTNYLTDNLADGEINREIQQKIKEKHEAEKKQLLSGIKDLNIWQLFSKCIDCHACSKVCPACYCHLCFFDSPTCDHEIMDYERELSNKKIIKLPLDNIFYHMVRISHISTSCVACGQCSDVCPVNIPLGILSIKTSEAVQGAYTYVAGRDVEESLPITCFTPDEFAEVGT
jgi:formate dehydrogenase subunit beta